MISDNLSDKNLCKKIKGLCNFYKLARATKPSARLNLTKASRATVTIELKHSKKYIYICVIFLGQL